MGFPILSLLIFAPVAAAIACLLCGDQRAQLARYIAVGSSAVIFFVSLLLYTYFDTSTAQMQFVERMPWINTFNIEYYLGIDGLSMPLIILSTFSTFIAILSAWDVIKDRAAQYMAAFLMLEGMMVGVFAALDAILFYVFWEALLIPMFLIIGIWGGPNRVYATIKFFLYTFFGSVFMLVAFIYLFSQTDSFSIEVFHDTPLSMLAQTWIFFAFFAAFAVKIPMVPVHTWLPDAHVEAPTAGSVILAAVLLKMGGYGFVRFSMPIVPDAAQAYDWFMITLSLVAIIYIGFIALVQQDMKKLVAYSSISHMGFVTLGLFIIWALDAQNSDPSAAQLGIEGAMMQMISHGFISAAMFLGIGVLYDRVHSRQIKDYGGVVNVMPRFGLFAVLFAMANAGLPGTSGFVGEFMVILAAFQANFWYGFLAAITLILGASYTLWMVKRVMYGTVVHDVVHTMKDLCARELFIMIVLALLVVVFGVWPDPIIEVMHASVKQLIEQSFTTKVIE